MKRLSLILSCLALLLAFPAAAHASSPDEYELKAVLLYKFIPFVEWPEAVSPKKQGRLDICILGEDPFGAMARVIEGQSTPQQKIQLHKSIKLQEISSCHILFISQSEESRVGMALEQARRFPVLTVSDIEGFASRGGAIGLFMNRQNKIKFEVNLKSANNANLKIDAQMLEVADRVVDR